MTTSTGDAAALAEVVNLRPISNPESDDVVRRDALENVIRFRLPMCDEAELREVDAALTEVERRREQRLYAKWRAEDAEDDLEVPREQAPPPPLDVDELDDQEHEDLIGGEA